MTDRNLLMDNWKPPECTLPPTQKLIHHTYTMLVSRSQVISPVYAEILGVPSSNYGAESVAQHGMITAVINGPRLAEIFAIGGRPMFKEVKDSVRLYMDLVGYLLAFRAAYENNVIRLDTNPNMMTNILKLENLAEWVFGIAAPYIPKEDMVHADSLAGRIGRGRFTRGTFAKKTPQEEAIDANLVIVTSGPPTSGPAHSRVTDKIMEQHFSNNVPVSKRRTGWS